MTNGVTSDQKLVLLNAMSFFVCVCVYVTPTSFSLKHVASSWSNRMKADTMEEFMEYAGESYILTLHE